MDEIERREMITSLVFAQIEEYIKGTSIKMDILMPDHPASFKLGLSSRFEPMVTMTGPEFLPTNFMVDGIIRNMLLFKIETLDVSSLKEITYHIEYHQLKSWFKDFPSGKTRTWL